MAKDKMNIPQIRFKGFEDEWQNSKLHDLVTSISGNDGRKNLPVLTISAGQGWMDQKDRFSQVIAGKELKNYTLLRKGELSYNKGNSKLAKYGVVFSLKNYEEALVPRVYHSFKVKKNVSSLYIEYLFATKKTDQELGKLITSGARMDGLLNISNTAFMGINIYSPSYKEQTQIGDFFQKIDQVIELQQKALDTARAYKQSMLQKMFPQKGEKVPRVRFAGFSGDWEVSSLGSIGKIKSGIGFSESEQGGTKGTPFFKVSDMNLPGNENVMTTANNYVSENQIISNKWKVITDIPSIIFAKVGAAIFLNRKRIVKESFLIDNNMMAYSFDEVWDSSFGKTLFDTLNLSRFAQVGALPSFNGSDIASIKILLPTKAEQTAIGNFFQKLDQQIEQQAQKLATYQQLKKAMLQRMFV